MKNSKPEANQPQSIADTVAHYTRLVDERDGPAQRLRNATQRIAEKTKGQDIATIAAKDPELARRIHAEISALQIDLLIDQAAVDQKDSQIEKLAPIIFEETNRLNEAREKIQTENFERVVANVVSRLTALQLWEEERLRRLALE